METIALITVLWYSWLILLLLGRYRYLWATHSTKPALLVLIAARFKAKMAAIVVMAMNAATLAWHQVYLMN